MPTNFFLFVCIFVCVCLDAVVHPEISENRILDCFWYILRCHATPRNFSIVDSDWI